MRKNSIRQQLDPIDLSCDVKHIILVHASIVRGTTCKEIVQFSTLTGPRNVYFASAAPPVRYPNVYGIDMPSASELIAHDRTVDEIGELIGTDWLLYQDLEDLVTCVSDVNDNIDGWECSVFTGEYITGDIDAAYLNRLDEARNDLKRSGGVEAVSGDNGIIDLHNDED